MLPNDFINSVYKMAIEAMHTTGVPASINIAQAGLESEWGVKAPGFNYFGEKAGASWTGAILKAHTTECGKTGVASDDGIYDEIIAIYPVGNPYHSPECPGKFSYRVYGIFKAYDSATAAFIEHGMFLKDSLHFGKLMGLDYKGWAEGLHSNGYATDPDYAQKLISIIETHKLNLCDAQQS